MKHSTVVNVAARIPPGETDCPHASLSNGWDCKKCSVQCYRRGWPKSKVIHDMYKRAAENWKRIREEKES